MVETKVAFVGDEVVTTGGKRFSHQAGIRVIEGCLLRRLTVSDDRAFILLWDPLGRLAPAQDSEDADNDEQQRKTKPGAPQSGGPILDSRYDTTRWGMFRFIEGMMCGFSKAQALLANLEREMATEDETEAAGAYGDARDKMKTLLRVLLSGEVG